MIDNITESLMSIPSKFIPHYNWCSWGSYIMIMEEGGRAFGRVYWYHDDDTTVYLDFLSVNVHYRRNGLGTELQIIRENIGKILGSGISCLWVIKGSWMHEWYQRRGYVDFTDHKTEENAIWMKKQLW